MSSTWNKGIRISVFGESHSKAIGIVVDNVPAGKVIDMAKVYSFMARRQAKKGGVTTPRIEADFPHIVSGIHNGTTNGTPIGIIIENKNTRSQDYDNVKNVPRPAHADYTGFIRYDGANDIRGGGHFSGRLTAPLVAAGAICGQILEQDYGVYTLAHLYSVKDIVSQKLDSLTLTKEDILKYRQLEYPLIDPDFSEKALAEINAQRMDLNSVGGRVECVATGMPVGVGSPMFEGLENTIASLIFGIPGIKGIEFGAGFDCTQMLGSENNDEFYVDEETNTVKTKTNFHGGILGGISSGMPITFNVAFKPTASISREQNSVDLTSMTNSKLEIVGRHDPCIAVRGACVVEAVTNIALLSALIG